MSWEAVYASDWQAVWALWVAPLAFLFFRVRHGPLRGADPAALLDAYCLGFAFLTLIDPVCTTLLVRWLSWSGTLPGSLTGLFFVLLGDFRVVLLVLALGRDPAQTGWGTVVLRSALLSAGVPAVAYALFLTGSAWTSAELDRRWLFLAHEALFVVLALTLRQRWLAQSAISGTASGEFVAAALTYVALYYTLWASADLLILAGVDAGFALRIVPNQLYYAFWIPFVWWRWSRV